MTFRVAESDAMVEGLPRVLGGSTNEDADLDADGDATSPACGVAPQLATCRSRSGSGAIRRNRRPGDRVGAHGPRAPAHRFHRARLIWSRRTPPCARCASGRPGSQSAHRSHRPPVPRHGGGPSARCERSVRAAVDAAIHRRAAGGASSRGVTRFGAGRVGEDTPAGPPWLFNECDFEPAYRFHHHVRSSCNGTVPRSRWRVKTPARRAQHRGTRPRVSRGPLRDHPQQRHQGDPVGGELEFETAVVRMMTGSSDPLYIGERCADTWDIGLRPVHRVRDRVSEERFYDVAFEKVRNRRRSAVSTTGWAKTSRLHGRRDGSLAEVERRSASKPANTSTTPRTRAFEHGQLSERLAYYAERFPIANKRSIA